MHILNYENYVIVYMSSSIRRANVGSHPIIFKSIRFGPFTVKRYPRVFKLKRSLRCFQKSPFLMELCTFPEMLLGVFLC